ncbi:MAG: hypothetical protein A2W22_00245 [Candidatus Levybacteria bacterium RBG_16_35_11]|nr:MAG: hypothetical protein A2W22_00245 [Candidatus Levybacteria bacterium RBG_16_35_11]
MRSKLKSGWDKWKKFGRIVANFQAQIIFTLFYFLILWTVGIIFHFASDPLNIKNKSKRSTFSNWDYLNDNLEKAKNPY